ncbi:MAG: hypothetical protein ACOVQM_21640, partial [Pirellula sp.]
MIVQPGGKAASVVSLKEETGEVRWQASELPAAYASPVVAIPSQQPSPDASSSTPVLIVTGAK